MDLCVGIARVGWAGRGSLVVFIHCTLRNYYICQCKSVLQLCVSSVTVWHHSLRKVSVQVTRAPAQPVSSLKHYINTHCIDTICLLLVIEVGLQNAFVSECQAL